MREFYSFIFENTLVGLLFLYHSGAHLILKNTEARLAFTGSKRTVAMNCTFQLFNMPIFFLLRSYFESFVLFCFP